MSELIAASRMNIKKQTIAHLMYDDKMGQTLCGLFNDPLDWTIWSFYRPPHVKLCFFCQLAAEELTDGGRLGKV